MNWLTSQCHVYRYLNNFEVALKYLGPLIRFELTCSITLDKIEDAVIDYVQIKVAKDQHTMTMNLITHTMKM